MKACVEVALVLAIFLICYAGVFPLVIADRLGYCYNRIKNKITDR